MTGKGSSNKATQPLRDNENAQIAMWCTCLLCEVDEGRKLSSGIRKHQYGSGGERRKAVLQIRIVLMRVVPS